MKKDKTHIELNKFSIEITKSIIINECIKYTFDAELADILMQQHLYLSIMCCWKVTPHTCSLNTLNFL